MDLVAAACRDVFGVAALRVTSLHGGDLSEVSRVTLADRKTVIAKHGPHVAREAHMLQTLAAAGAPTPRVLGLSGPVLFLQDLGSARPARDAWAQLGADLAALHAHHGDGYGWSEDYAFGSVTIPNAPTSDWPTFWAERRLAPSLPYLPTDLARRVEALAAYLPDTLPKAPPASLLHGDLWSGNLHPGPDGLYALIDPACYHGDGEVDLAMLHLFATPGPGFTAAYGPLAPGWERRRAIYTLFPALVHLRLFGSGYRSLVERCLDGAGG